MKVTFIINQPSGAYLNRTTLTVEGNDIEKVTRALSYAGITVDSVNAKGKTVTLIDTGRGRYLDQSKVFRALDNAGLV